MSFSVVAKHRT